MKEDGTSNDVVLQLLVLPCILLLRRRLKTINIRLERLFLVSYEKLSPFLNYIELS